MKVTSKLYNQDCYKYTLWAWGYVKGEYKEWYKNIYRKNKLTPEQKESLISNFTSNIITKHNCNLQLWGCNENYNT